MAATYFGKFIGTSVDPGRVPLIQKSPNLPRSTRLKLSLILLLSSLSLVVGCSTLATTIGGAACDISFWHTAPFDQGFIIIDLPFSALADTLLLPYSIPMQMKHGDLCPGDQKP